MPLLFMANKDFSHIRLTWRQQDYK